MPLTKAGHLQRDFAGRIGQQHTPLTGSYNWDYDTANAKIRRLYELGKAHNWNTTVDVDWDAPCDLNGPPGLGPEALQQIEVDGDAGTVRVVA